MKKSNKLMVAVLSCVMILAVLNVGVYAISSSNISVTSPSYGYYLPGESLSCSLTISGASNNPATVRLLYPYYTVKNAGRGELGFVEKNASSYTYTGTYFPNKAHVVPGRKVGSHGSWQSRNFCIEAKKDGSTITKEVSGYITLLTRTEYANVDSTFRYTNSTSNSFQGVGTPSLEIDTLTYNCLAYAVSINTSWEWPWVGNPTQSELDDYMLKRGNYSSRSGDTFAVSTLNGCDVIYYTNETTWGSGSDGHFARVIAWDASGNPTKISSKWGECEVIESSSYNPFKKTGSYGSPKRYYKY